MKKRLYTYKDWIQGRVVLAGNIFIPSGTNPTIVDWNTFSELDKKLIKERQELIFENLVNEQLEKFKSVFTSRYNSSSEKEILLNAELSQVEEIFKASIPSIDFYRTSHWNAVYSFEEISKIQAFYRDVIIKGENYSYDFVQPYDSQYVNRDIIPYQIYTIALWKYHNWLKEFSPSPSNQSKVEILIDILRSYGFFTLPKIKSLTQESSYKLVSNCISEGVPYTVAMFNFLDFFSHLEDNYFGNKKNDTNKIVASWFNVTKCGRSIKGNRSVLIKTSNESRSKYTAHLYIEKVKKDYKTY